MKIFNNKILGLYEEILEFLEIVYKSRGQYTLGNHNSNKPIDALVLNFIKVVNDCRSIILLCKEGFYIQAGIICRSTLDASNLMMHIALEGDNAPLFKEWINNKNISHWKIIKKINKHLNKKLNIGSY